MLKGCREDILGSLLCMGKMNYYYNFVKTDDFCSEVWYDLLMDNQELSIECEYNIINGNG